VGGIGNGVVLVNPDVTVQCTLTGQVHYSNGGTGWVHYTDRSGVLVMEGTCHGGWWRWALVSRDRVAPIQMAGVSASVNLPLHHKVQKFSTGTGSSGWSRKKGRKMVVVVVVEGTQEITLSSVYTAW